MDNALGALFSWQFLLFSLGIFAVVWFLRTLSEYFFPKLVGAKLWEKLILPTTPSAVGAGIAYIATAYPYPDGLVALSARLLFGIVAGMFSGLVYQVANGMLKNRIQSYIPTILQPPPSPPLVPPGPPPSPPQS